MGRLPRRFSPNFRSWACSSSTCSNVPLTRALPLSKRIRISKLSYLPRSLEFGVHSNPSEFCFSQRIFGPLQRNSTKPACHVQFFQPPIQHFCPRQIQRNRTCKASARHWRFLTPMQSEICIVTKVTAAGDVSSQTRIVLTCFRVCYYSLGAHSGRGD